MMEGGCLCGAVRFRVVGPPKWTAYCHCASCRRHTGAPVSAYAGYESAQFSVTAGALKWFDSSANTKRGFCVRCGSTLTYASERWAGEMHVHIGAFDDPEAVPPKSEAFADERLTWLHLGVPKADP